MPLMTKPSLANLMKGRSLRGSESVLAVRDSTSHRLWRSTEHLADRCAELAKTIPTYEGEPSTEVTRIGEAISSFAAAATITSVAWAEASVNEVYIDCERGSSEPSVLQLPELSGRLLGDVWRRWQENSPRKVAVRGVVPVKLPKAEREPGTALEKMLRAMKLCGVRHPLNELPSAQDFKRLIALRNALVHAKPEFLQHGRSNSEKELGKLQEMLEGLFPYAVGVSENATFIWSRCLGLGCAEWALGTTRSILAEWFVALRRASEKLAVPGS